MDAGCRRPLAPTSPLYLHCTSAAHVCSAYKKNKNLCHGPVSSFLSSLRRQTYLVGQIVPWSPFRKMAHAARVRLRSSMESPDQLILREQIHLQIYQRRKIQEQILSDTLRRPQRKMRDLKCLRPDKSLQYTTRNSNLNIM